MPSSYVSGQSVVDAGPATWPKKEMLSDRLTLTSWLAASPPRSRALHSPSGHGSADQSWDCDRSQVRKKRISSLTASPMKDARDERVAAGLPNLKADVERLAHGLGRIVVERQPVSNDIAAILRRMQPRWQRYRVILPLTLTPP